jgi:hypothetical protein
MLTHEIKLQVFMEGHPDWDAQFTVPPVPHALWEAEDWVRWVDSENGSAFGYNGHWIRKEKD